MNKQEYDQIIKTAADLERGAEAECKKEIEKRQKYKEGYSKGYPMPQSVTGFDSEKYERLQIRDMERKERLKKECEEIERFVDDIKDSITHRIFRIYFIDGRKNVTLREVGKRVHMGRSGVGKRIENFLKVSRNSHDSHLQ